ncbi:MAG: Stk1 family PASTA domain-containing Ser/Thr kinase [Ruminococcaceae bacterium]|nr:Stk1 family PASTA domain-containing Ser/Thr kinase [Oscillospiraceae bacterium]
MNMELYEKYVGLVFDNRYRIERVIGIGGMAVVFKATDILMRRMVAVKILKDEISGDDQSVKRFINESKAVAMLSHQNIVNIYDVSVRENIKYIVMEYVEGITLKNYIQHREVLNLREIISYTSQILRALEHAHKKGIVHRDIKPHNIMLLKNGVIKVTDFGIAKLPNTETVTMTEKAIGTVYYISPEQASGKEIDARSDLYSLGIMMYEMATGSLPFTGESPVSVALMQVNENPTLPREINPYIPAGLEQIIMHAMEKDPEARYQSAEEMLSHLLMLRENPKIIFKERRTPKTKKKPGEKKPKAPKTPKPKARKPRHRPSKSMFPIIMGVTLAFLIAACVSAYYVIDKLLFNSTLNNYENIEVENFINAMYTDDLAEWFDTSNYYNVPELNYVYNDTVPKGVIVSQDPAPKEVRKVLAGKQKCSISFEISLGVREMILEDYTVQDYRVVDQAIRKLGLKVKIIHVSSDTHEIGFVIKTEPAAGTVVQDNDTITVYVSKGTDTVKTTVPDFTGLNEAQVLLQLMEANLHVGKVTYVRDDGVPGLVLSQSIDAWYEVPIYTSVDFTISGGPSYSGDGSTVPTPEDLEESKPEVNYPPYNPTYPDDDEDDDDNDNWFVDNEPEETQSSWKDFYDWWMGRQ